MFLSLKRQKIVRMHKTCLTSQFLRLSLGRFSREMAYLPSRKNLANESLRNCDVRQVLCILTIFCRFKPKNVCILPKFSSFQLFQSKIILVQCCKSHCPSRVSIFSNFPCLSVNIFVCKFVYIVRTDQNPFGSCQPFSILYIMTACAAAHWATCDITTIIETFSIKSF